MYPIVHIISLFLATLCAAQPSTQAPPQDIDLKSLSPRDRQLIIQRAKRCLRLPDGSIADTSPYYQLHDDIANDVRKLRATVERTSGPMVEKVPVGPSWWEADPNSATSLAWRTGPLKLPSGEWACFRGAAPSDPPLLEWDKRRYKAPFDPFYIDADKPDPVTKSRDIPGVAVIDTELPRGMVKVTLTSLHGGTKPRDFYVQLPPGVVPKNRYLPGRFILWPDPSIPNPATGTSALAAAQPPGEPFTDAEFWTTCGPDKYVLSPRAIEFQTSDARKEPPAPPAPDLPPTKPPETPPDVNRARLTYRYIPLTAMTVTPEELLSGLRSGTVTLYDWMYTIHDRHASWSKKVFQVGQPRPKG